MKPKSNKTAFQVHKTLPERKLFLTDKEERVSIVLDKEREQILGDQFTATDSSQ